jgi:glycosyltransferase involved in cell wall biosynthesis
VPTNIFVPPVARALNTCIILGSARAHRDLVPPLHRRLLHYTDKLVDGIVVNCEFLRRHLLEDYRLSPGLIHLCRNGIDTSEFSPAGRPRPQEFHDASLVIGIVCVLRPEKSIHTLIDAFAQVRPSAPGIKLAIVGSGPLRDPLIQQTRDLGVTQDCIFVPARGGVAPLLRGIDIFALPSLSEASSNSLLEAMACGCCPVASRVGGNPELVQDGISGFLFDSGDASQLAAILRRLIEQPDLRVRLAQTAAQYVCENFVLETSARRMQQIYTQYLTGREAHEIAENKGT